MAHFVIIQSLIVCIVSVVYGYVHPDSHYYRNKALPPCRNYTLESGYELEACWQKDFTLRFHNRTMRRFTYQVADSMVNILQLCLLNQPQDHMCPMQKIVRTDYGCAYISRSCDNLMELCFNANHTLVHGRIIGSGTHLFTVPQLTDLLTHLTRYVYHHRVAE